MIKELNHLAKLASKEIRNLDNQTRNNVLADFSSLLVLKYKEILFANSIDLENNPNLSESLKDRLALTKDRIIGIANGVKQLIELEDPINEVIEERVINSGIKLVKKSVPIGVVGIIYEARPNVTADCFALCFKSGNACVLKGGKEAYVTSSKIVELIKLALAKNNVNENAIVLLPKITHEETKELMEDKENIDLLIPRGSKRLIQSVVDNATVPVIETGAGVCHIYVDETADFEMAKKIIINAKTSRPSVCNAMECLIVNEAIKDEFLPLIIKELKDRNVVIHGDYQDLLPVDDYHTEYDDLEMNLKIVKDVYEAVKHIETYSTHHSEAIISNNQNNVDYFMNNIDSACLYHNASTRFSDGFEFGLGAEIGISTQKLHARGPMGLKALTTYTYLLYGNGEVR